MTTHVHLHVQPQMRRPRTRGTLWIPAGFRAALRPPRAYLGHHAVHHPVAAALGALVMLVIWMAWLCWAGLVACGLVCWWVALGVAAFYWWAGRAIAAAWPTVWGMIRTDDRHRASRGT